MPLLAAAFLAAGLALGDTAPATDGAAFFVRLQAQKRALYVGESVPVEIEIGLQDDVVASLDNPPALNGDAFTLNALSSKPDREEKLQGGKAYTVLTWHGTLAAVKPGSLSLTIEAPLTVRIRTPAHPEANFVDDPSIEGLFEGVSEQQIIAASPPAAFDVLALPTENRPAGFNGAVGKFKISSELSRSQTTAGDPLTLRMHVSGAGNFDRVDSVMLREVEHWKLYRPTSTFTSIDDIGFRGEKTFEQPLIAIQPGTQELPELTFSYFDPDSHHYEIARSAPLSIRVAAGASDSPPAAARAQARAPSVPRADHADTGRIAASVVPLYYQPQFLAIPSALIVAFSGAWVWLRRREVRSEVRRQGEPGATPFIAPLRQMESAAATGNAVLFFNAASRVLIEVLAAHWRIAPHLANRAAIEARLGPQSEIRLVFQLADEANYAGAHLEAGQLQHWKQIVLHHVANCTR